MSDSDFMRLPPDERRKLKEALAAFSASLDRLVTEVERRERVVDDFKRQLEALPTTPEDDVPPDGSA